MKAVIMAGGEGIRLRPLTISCSKPLLPVVNRPLIEHSVNYLKKYGITDITVSLFYQPDDIIERLGGGSPTSVNLRFSIEKKPLGTAGGVKKAIGKTGTRTIVISGDTVSDIPLDELIDFHESRKSEFTAALVNSERPEDYGVAVTDSSMRITSFQEKPASGSAASCTVNTGIYIIEPHILNEFVIESERCDFSIDLIPALIRKNKKIFGFLSDKYWCDAGTVSSYLEVHRDILDGRADVVLGGELSISPLRYLSSGPVLIGAGCRISPEANLAAYSVIGEGAFVDRGVFVSESVIHEGSSIASDAVINGSIIGKNCTVGSRAVIGGGAVIGEGAVIPADAVLPAGIKIAPGTVYAGRAAVEDISYHLQSIQEYSFSFAEGGSSEITYDRAVLIDDFISRLKRFNA